MVTQWNECQKGVWRGHILFLSDSEEYDFYRFHEEQEQTWYEYIKSYFY